MEREPSESHIQDIGARAHGIDVIAGADCFT